MLDAPAISVVIPTYNAAKFLREALDSLLAQTFTNWEAVCVNDGSTDNSLEILQEYAARDSRFRILDGPNGGYGKAMNRGMDAAAGKYLAILEPDDFLPAHAYEALYSAAEKHDLDITRGAVCHFWQKKGHPRYCCQYDSTPKMQVLRPREHACAFRAAPNTWTCLYRMEHLRRNNIRHHESPGASYQDDGMFFQNMAYAERCMWVDDIVYMYRIDNPASSIQAGARKPFAEMEEFAFIRRRMEEAPEIWQQVKTYYTGLYIGAQRWIYPRIAEETRREFLCRFREQLPELRALGLNGLQPELMQGVEALERSVEEFMESGAWIPHPQPPAPASKEKKLRFLGIPLATTAAFDNKTRKYVFGIPVLSQHRISVLHDLGDGLLLPLGARDHFRVLGIPFAHRDIDPGGKRLSILGLIHNGKLQKTTVLNYPEARA